MPDNLLPIGNRINRAFISCCVAFAINAIASTITTKAFAQSVEELPWKLACASDNKNFCLMRYNLTNENGQTISRVVIGESSSGERRTPYINTFLPLKLLIPAGVGFRVDEGSPVKLNLQYCDQEFCRASALLNENQINSMKRGQKLQLILTDSNSKKPIGLNFSLIGFTKKFNEFKTAINN